MGCLVNAQMLEGIYQNAASMSGLQNWNDAIAQNIAQSSAPGYKKAILSFEGSDNGLVGFQDAFDRAVYRQAIGAGTKGAVDFSSGPIRITNDQFDFAIEGSGFFELRTPEGEFVYTRDGEFKSNEKGELVSKQGYHVMSDDRTVIQMIPDGGVLTGDIDGTIRQGGQKIAQIGLRDLDDYSRMVRSHGGFIVPDGGEIGAPHTNTILRHGSLEDSNVSATHEMINLINVSRAFQINQKVIQNQDELTERAIRHLGGHL